MINFSIGLIIGLLIGAYAASPAFRRKINARVLKKEVASSNLNACKACNGTSIQILKTGLKVKCPVCKVEDTQK